jgi:1-acyl-sn-glycerol-3-phosphate acyltransferase
MPFDGLTGRVSYAAHYWFTFWLLTLGWGYRRGGRHLPADGPALLVANHQSFIDPLLVAMAAGRPLTFLARSDLFDHSPFAKLIDRYGAVPIDRGFGKAGIERVLELLAAGRRVLLFPEGSRTDDGRLLPLKPGVSLLVRRAGVPVVPVGIAGAFEAWPRDRLLPRTAPLAMPDTGCSVAVHVGRAIPPGRYKGMSRDDILADVSAEMAAAFAAAERLRRRSV